MQSLISLAAPDFINGALKAIQAWVHASFRCPRLHVHIGSCVVPYLQSSLSSC